MRIGTNELLIILAVALLIFGPKNLTITAKQILYPQCVAMDHNSPIQNLHI